MQETCQETLEAEKFQSVAGRIVGAVVAHTIAELDIKASTFSHASDCATRGERSGGEEAWMKENASKCGNLVIHVSC